jgi:hypothetical protein
MWSASEECLDGTPFSKIRPDDGDWIPCDPSATASSCCSVKDYCMGNVPSPAKRDRDGNRDQRHRRRRSIGRHIRSGRERSSPSVSAPASAAVLSRAQRRLTLRDIPGASGSVTNAAAARNSRTRRRQLSVPITDTETMKQVLYEASTTPYPELESHHRASPPADGTAAAAGMRVITRGSKASSKMSRNTRPRLRTRRRCWLVRWSEPESAPLTIRG